MSRFSPDARSTTFVRACGLLVAIVIFGIASDVSARAEGNARVSHFECSLDAGPWFPCPTKVPLEDLPDGPHAYRERLQGPTSSQSVSTTARITTLRWVSDAGGSAKVCDRYASPLGSDTASGSSERPVRTAQALVSRLGPGETGCLRGGTYAGPLVINHGGTSTARLTLRSAPGARATIRGPVWIANPANFVTVAYINLDGTNPERRASPIVNGDNSVFFADSVTNRTGVCFYLGDPQYGIAHHTVVATSRIHACGSARPGTNHIHGFYIAHAVNTVIRDDYIYANQDRGIQFYPDSRNALVERNTFDRNGESIDFSGDYGLASSGNIVRNNLITSSRLGNDVESWYPTGNPLGTGNAASRNCIFGGRDGPIQAPAIGFRAADNVTEDPRYVDPVRPQLGLKPSSPCWALLGGATRPALPR
jgi:hypothetical protein